MKKCDISLKDAAGQKLEKKTYRKPKIISSEMLETVAATCDSNPPTFGKALDTVPPCGTLNS